MANTMTLISSVTVGAGGASSIDFTSIPSTYTDLCLKFSARTTRPSTGSDIYLQFNGVTTATYSFRRLYGYGSGAASGSLTNDSAGGFAGNADAANNTASTFGNAEVYIPNYAGSTAKSWSVDSVLENNATDAIAEIIAGLWSGTAAITSIKLQDYTGYNFVQYSTAYLYGVKNA
jgi:hypothetical protein